MEEYIIEVKNTDLLIAINNCFEKSTEFTVKFDRGKPVLSYYHRPYPVADEAWKAFRNSYYEMPLKSINYKILGKVKDLTVGDKIQYVSQDASQNKRYGRINQEFDQLIGSAITDRGLLIEEPISPPFTIIENGVKIDNPKYDLQWSIFKAQSKIFISPTQFSNIIVLKKHIWSKFHLLFK